MIDQLMIIKNAIEVRFLGLFQKLFPSQKHQIEVGVVGSTLLFVITVVALTALGFAVQSKAFKILSCAGAIVGYFLFVSIHRRD